MKRSARPLVCCVAAIACWASARGESAPADPRLPALSQRLIALDTNDALACFLLAEEVAEEFDTEPARHLARTLLVLAHEAAQSADRPDSAALSRSVMLALASLARDDQERLLMEALAESEGATSTGASAASNSLAPIDPVALEIAEAIGHYRAGDGRTTRDISRKPHIQSYLARWADILRHTRIALEGAEDSLSCTNCRNRRTIRNQVPGQPGETVDTLCPVCRGNPGPELAPVLFARLLGEEARLLNAEPRSWHAQFWIDQGRPFDDPTGSDLASRFGVDPKLTRWTPSAEQPSNPFEGSWVEPG